MIALVEEKYICTWFARNHSIGSFVLEAKDRPLQAGIMFEIILVSKLQSDLSIIIKYQDVTCCICSKTKKCFQHFQWIYKCVSVQTHFPQGKLISYFYSSPLSVFVTFLLTHSSYTYCQHHFLLPYPCISSHLRVIYTNGMNLPTWDLLLTKQKSFPLPINWVMQDL